jgi:hypothetical protein
MANSGTRRHSANSGCHFFARELDPRLPKYRTRETVTAYRESGCAGPPRARRRPNLPRAAWLLPWTSSRTSSGMRSLPGGRPLRTPRPFGPNRRPESPSRDFRLADVLSFREQTNRTNQAATDFSRHHWEPGRWQGGCQRRRGRMARFGKVGVARPLDDDVLLRRSRPEEGEDCAKVTMASAYSPRVKSGPSNAAPPAKDLRPRKEVKPFTLGGDAVRCERELTHLGQ